MRYLLEVEEGQLADPFTGHVEDHWRYRCSCGKKSFWQNLSFNNAEKAAWAHVETHRHADAFLSNVE